MIFNVSQVSKSNGAIITINTNSVLVGQTIKLYYGTIKIAEKTVPESACVKFNDGICLGEYTVKAEGGGRRYEDKITVTGNNSYTVNLDTPVGAKIFISGAVTLAPKMLTTFTVPEGYYKPDSANGFQIQVIDAIGGGVIDTLTISEDTAFISVDTNVYSKVTLKASNEVGFSAPTDLTFDIAEGTRYDKTETWVEKYITQVVTTSETDLLGAKCTVSCGDIEISGTMTKSITFILKSVGDWSITCGEASESITVTELNNTTLTDVDLSLAIQLTVGNTYTMAGYSWGVINSATGGYTLALLTGIISSYHPAYTATGSYTIDNWSYKDISYLYSTYKSIYTAIKNADLSKKGMYLCRDGIYNNANWQKFNLTSWSGTYSHWDTSIDGARYYIEYPTSQNTKVQNADFKIVPFFDLDASKAKLVGNQITIK